MDISLQVIVVPATHTLPTEKHERRYVAGDIVDVISTAKLADWDGTEYRVRGGITSPRLGFVHITGIPDRPLERIRNKLTRPYVDRDSVLVANPTGAILKRRAWRVPPTSIPAPIRNRLQTRREITVTWAQVKNFVANKMDGAALTDTSFDTDG